MEFSETSAPKDRFNVESRQVKLKEGISYYLKLAFSESALSVYVDDIHRLHVPSYLSKEMNATLSQGLGLGVLVALRYLNSSILLKMTVLYFPRTI